MNVLSSTTAEERLQLALDAGAIIGTWYWSIPENLFTADERFARSFGLDPELCRGGLPLEAVMTSIHEDDRPRVTDAINEVMGRGGRYRCEYRVRQHDGVFRWIEANGRVELGADGTPLRFPGVLLDIEQRRAAEAERDQATALLETFIEAVPGVVYAKDRQGRMLIANRGTTELIGRSQGEYLGRTDSEFLPDRFQAAAVMATDRLVMESGIARQVEEEVQRPDGTPSVWLSTKAPLRDKAGAIIGLIGTSVDITERKRVEAALAAELKAMKRLHELSQVVVQSESLPAVLETILQAAIDLHGSDFANIQLYDEGTQTLRIAAQRGFRQPFLDHFAEVNAGEPSACGLALARRERVMIHDVESDPAYAPTRAVAREAGYRAVQSTPLLTSSGEPIGMLSTHFRQPHRLSDSELRLTDIYARLASDAIARCKAGEALRAVQERLQAALSAGRMAAWDWDPATDRVVASGTLPDLLGLRPGETWQRGAQWDLLVHPDDRERRKIDAEAAGRAGGSWHGEFRVIRPRDGRVVWLEERAHAVHSAQTGHVSIAGLVWDITERKQAEERLSELQAELLHLSRLGAMGEMAAVLAHELNQPLTAISNYIYGAGRLAGQRDPDSSRRLQDLLRKAADQALRAGETIRRVRGFVARGRSNKQPEDVLPLVKEACDLALIGASGQGISVVCQFDERVGRVCVDKIQIQQVLLNLIRNAVEAMQEVERRELLIVVRPAGPEMVEVCVSDTGPGIPPEVAAHLFQPFVTAKPEGLGVGLSVCRNIIEAHHGRLWAEPNRGGGTAFHLTLPVAVAS